MLYIMYWQEQDPFWEPTDNAVHIGSVHVYLHSLSYNVSSRRKLVMYVLENLQNLQNFPHICTD